MGHPRFGHMLDILAEVALSSGLYCSCGHGVRQCCSPSWHLWAWPASVLPGLPSCCWGTRRYGLWAKWWHGTHWAPTKRGLRGCMLQARILEVPLTHAYTLAHPEDCVLCYRCNSCHLGSRLPDRQLRQLMEGAGGATWKCGAVTPCRANFDHWKWEPEDNSSPYHRQKGAATES